MIEARIYQNGEQIAVFSLSKKDFKTGSKGHHASGKLELDGKKHQVNLLLVEIGSKNQK